MFELIIGIAATVLFSCVILWSYRRGIKDGLALKDNKPIEPIKSPVRAFNEVKEAKEISKVEEKQEQFMTYLFGYSGEKQDEVK
jgi:hypothetical protein